MTPLLRGLLLLRIHIIRPDLRLLMMHEAVLLLRHLNGVCRLLFLPFLDFARVRFDAQVLHEEFVVDVAGGDFLAGLLIPLRSKGRPATNTSHFLQQRLRILLHLIHLQHLLKYPIQRHRRAISSSLIGQAGIADREAGLGVGDGAGRADFLHLLLFFFQRFDFFLRWFEEELSLVDRADFFHAFLRVVPESDGVLVLALEPLDGPISVV